MKAKLEYNLPDDNFEFECAIKGTMMALDCDDIREYIRGILKHTDVSDQTAEYLERIRDMLPPSIE